MWLNFDFAPPAEQQHLLSRFTDVSAIAKMAVPAYGIDEVCQRYVVPDGARLVDLFSHTHKRGKRFRIFEGQFTCQGGPNNGDACSPLRSDRSLPVPDLCAGAPCQSAEAPTIGDCDHNLNVSVDELVTGVNIALGTMSPAMCPAFDGNDDGAVMIDEVVAGVDAALRHGWRDPEASLIYTSLTYADPLVLTLDPPKLYGAVGTTAAARTLTYCALYDNGFSNPDTVKRNSRVPDNGLPCRPTNCTTGLAEARCSTDADCDSAPGKGDGFCDACRVHFGVTTEDEMFVLLGSYITD